MATGGLAFSPYHMYLFKKACRKGTEKDKTIRINIVGNNDQGKTSLTRRLLGKTCQGVTSTNGIDINRYRCKSSAGGKRNLTIVEDEDEDFVSRIASIAQSIDVKTDGLKDDPEADEIYLNWSVRGGVVQIDMKRESDNNKTDSVHPDKTRSVSYLSTEELKSFTTKIDEINDHTDAILDFWDFGGQFSFYATHTLFHSRKALYLLVFDLSSPLNKKVKDEECPTKTDDKTMEYYARFWIESIHYFVGPEPPVILVGTHKDKLEGDQLTKLEAKDKYFDQVRNLFESTDMIYHIQNEDFAVDNNDPSDADFEQLLNVILQKGLEIVKTSEIPGRWIALEKGLYQEKHRKIIPFRRVMEINDESEYPLNDDEELKLFLQYHHEKGSLIYFDEDPISEHVVLDPQYIVDAFKCIITAKKFRLKDPCIREAWTRLTSEGKLTNTLIDKVWTNNFIENKHILLAYLKKHNIITQVVEYDGKSGLCVEQDWYVIPSLLGHHTEQKDRSLYDFLAGKSQTQIRYLMQFEKSNIVQIVYHRLLAAFLGKWPVICFGNKQLLFQNICALKLTGSYAGIAEMRSSSIELRVCSLASRQIECSVPDNFRRFAEYVVTQEFTKLKYQLDDKINPFLRKYRCNHKVHNVQGSLSVSNLSSLKTPEETALCPDNYSHEEFDCSKAVAEWFLGSQSEIIFPKTLLSDKSLSNLAQSAIGRNWELLGPELGISQAIIDHIKADNSSEAMRIYSLLRKWRDLAGQYGDSATLDGIAKALHSCSTVYVDWDEMRNIRDKLQGSASNERSDLKSDNVHEGQCGETECTGQHTVDKKPLEFSRGLKNQHVAKKYCTVIFKCKLNRVANVQWYCNNRQLSSSSKYTIVGDRKRHSLIIKDVCDRDEGKYRVIAEGKQSEGSLIVEDTEEEKALLRMAQLRLQLKSKSKTDTESPPTNTIHQSPSVEDHNEMEEKRRAKMPNPKVTDIESQRAVIHYSEPEVDTKEYEIDIGEFNNDLMLRGATLGPRGRVRSLIQYFKTIPDEPYQPQATKLQQK